MEACFCSSVRASWSSFRAFSEVRVAVVDVVVVDWLRRVGRDLRLVVRRGMLRGAREQKRHTLGVGVVVTEAVTPRSEVLRLAKGRRLSRGGIVCRVET